MKLLIIIICFALSASVLAQEVYIWTDEHGKKHFSDNPPAVEHDSQVEVSTETFELENGYDSPSYDSNAASPNNESYTDRKVRERIERKQRAKSRNGALADACEKARSRLTAMNGNVNFFDEDGKQVRVSEAQRQAEHKALREDIKKRCTGAASKKTPPRPKCPGKLTAPHLTAAEYRKARKQMAASCLKRQQQWDRANRY